MPCLVFNVGDILQRMSRGRRRDRTRKSTDEEDEEVGSAMPT
jgi:hypothetical protein